jgi:hypothetical protein
VGAKIILASLGSGDLVAIVFSLGHVFPVRAQYCAAIDVIMPAKRQTRRKSG